MTEPLAAVVARRIRQYRKARRFSQAELAARATALGVPMERTTITTIESESRRVSLVESVALAAALGVPLLALLLPDKDEDVELMPNLTLRAELAEAWAVGRLPLREEDVDTYMEAVEALQRVQLPLHAAFGRMFDPVSLDSLFGRRGRRPIGDEREALRALVEQGRREVEEAERMAQGYPADSELALSIGRMVEARRQAIEAIEHTIEEEKK